MDLTGEYSLDIDVNDHARNILKKLDSMRHKQKNCDLVIKVEGKEIHVNRDVMCAASDYFYGMFSHDTKEKQGGIIMMKDIEFSIIEKCINFIYSGKISVSEDECEGLLYCASLMQLNEVVDKISQFLENQLTPKSFFNIHRLAIKFSLKTLNSICDKFASDQLIELANENEFNDLDIDYLSFLLSTKRSLGHRTEDSRLFIALRWIKADVGNREEYFMQIAKLLDTSKLTPAYSKFLIENEPLFVKFPEFKRELFIGNVNFHCVEAAGPLDLSELLSSYSVKCPNSLFVFDESSKLVQLYQPSENRLTPVIEYHCGIDRNITTCVLKEYLYVFNMNKKVFRLNIRERNSAWMQLTDMLHDHENAPYCAVHEKFIYVSGGDKMERYKIGESEKWEDVDLDGNICHCSALVGYKECVFLIGGFQGRPLNTVRKFSPSSSTWTSVMSMNFARFHAAATVVDHKVYVAGGVNGRGLGDFEMYDGMTDLWTILPKMISPKCFFSLCLVDNQIFAVGNCLGNCSMEVYDLEHEKWILHDNALKIKIRAPATLVAYIPIK